MDGLVVIDKPAGCTSHDVVNRVRKFAGTRKVGHLGTLDPMATGVLPLVIGRATRLAQFFQRSDKVYDAAVRFGYSTDTYDRDGRATSLVTDVNLDPARLAPILARFIGRIHQIPPAYSAKKVGGVPSYRLARKNAAVRLAPVEVEIYDIEMIRCCDEAVAEIRVHCAAGTYVRSLAHELGQALGCGAFLRKLRRTASGGFDVAMARTLPQLEQLTRDGRFDEAIIPSAHLLPEFPTEFVDAATAGLIRQGRDFRVSPFRTQAGKSRYVKAISEQGDLVAIGEARLPNVYHPVLVL